MEQLLQTPTTRMKWQRTQPQGRWWRRIRVALWCSQPPRVPRGSSGAITTYSSSTRGRLYSGDPAGTRGARRSSSAIRLRLM
eukprot:1336391-Rhodomonas_salina.1